MKKTLLALSVIAASGMVFAAEQTETTVDPQFKNEATHDMQIANTDEEEGTQSSAKGFLADDTLSLKNRTYFLQKNYSDPGDVPNYSEDTADGVMAEYKSGFTQGTLGFGLDGYVYSGVKLDTGRGRNFSGSSYPFYLNPVDSDGDAEDTWSKGGIAAKLRISATEVKYGQQRPAAPVYSTGDSFLLPETSTGVYIASNEIKGLALEAGHFTAASDFVSTSNDDDLLLNYGSGKIGNAIDFAGGAYTFSDNLSASFYASDFSETWNQYYGNVKTTFPFPDAQNINVDLNVYRTLDTGNAYQGDINNTTGSLAVTYTRGAHAFTLSHQIVDGDTPFDYVGYDSIWVSNYMMISDFNGPEEESNRAAYELDMGTLGVHGLTFKVSYVTGDDIDGTKADPTGGYAGYYGKDGKHWERDFDIQYVVPTGAAKNLSIRLRQGTARGNADQGDGSQEQVRFIIEYPWDAI